MICQTSKSPNVSDDEPKSSIVRVKPAVNSAILKTVTTKDEVIFYITGSNNDWFEISKIETTGGDIEEAIFEGHGWIHSSLIDLSVASADAKLYAAPRKRAAS